MYNGVIERGLEDMNYVLREMQIIDIEGREIDESRYLDIVIGRFILAQDRNYPEDGGTTLSRSERIVIPLIDMHYLSSDKPLPDFLQHREKHVLALKQGRG